ncbi:glycosyltransferase family 2 protein [Neobacillus sp. YIM B06451]|uniref:glycosyltransferase family 2 protein n=1 Tax=Neobacillus sp. YIM B06451 TaxID=3070994 RepID=UPI00292E623C|nr:glycosyltransferase family 2 protein [Neobacillus sp. YIM B06451]
MEIPFLSTVIPVYNAEKTVSRAIYSILSQDFYNMEIIIINDGSTDRSLEICQNIARIEPRIRLFSIENSGVSNARNLGIEQAQGKYITFLDADDYYMDGYLKVIMAEIEPNTQLVLFGYNVVRGGKSYPCTFPEKMDSQFSTQAQFRKAAITLIENELINAPWNKVYLTSYIKNNKINFPVNIDIGEDLRFNLLVIKNINYVKVSNQMLVNYTVKKGEGLVSRYRRNRLEIRLSLLRDIRDMFEYWGLLEENRSMLDRMLLKDFMASFMDLYKKTCNFSYKEKLDFIKSSVYKEDKVLKSCSTPDLLTQFLKLVINTKNSAIILFFARIMSLKRGF